MSAHLQTARCAAALLLLLGLVGCDNDDAPDGGAVDSGALPDAGSTRDAGELDAGPTDAGVSDAGPADSGPADSGPADSGPGDSGAGDAGTADAATDAGLDAGGSDAGDDAGLDAGVLDGGDPDAGPTPPRYVDCDSSRLCETGFRCEGFVASIGLGKCVPTAVPPGEGEECSALDDCGDDLLCGGYTRGFGLCLPAWMRESFSEEVTAAIPDGSSEGLIRTLTVYGIATVDMDVVIDLSLDHPAPSELRIVLRNPGGTEALVYDGSAESDPPGRVVIAGPVFGFSGDESVNGEWTLEIVDGSAGNAGTLERWTLTVASRYD